MRDPQGIKLQFATYLLSEVDLLSHLMLGNLQVLTQVVLFRKLRKKRTLKFEWYRKGIEHKLLHRRGRNWQQLQEQETFSWCLNRRPW